MRVFAVRGAITCEANTSEDILSSTDELLGEMIRRNEIHVDEVISIVFTTTPDLNAAFPAKAARSLGFSHTALMCMREIDVPDALPKCIRSLIYLQREDVFEPEFVYLRDAKKLRPDLCR